MKILFLATANNSLCQRLAIELVDCGHNVAVELTASGDEMLRSVSRHAPDLIIAPMLKPAIPEAIWSSRICLVVHPGIEGDRGPSSLDWAITTGEKSWGVTILQAVAEMDAGPVWATRGCAWPTMRKRDRAIERKATGFVDGNFGDSVVALESAFAKRVDNRSRLKDFWQLLRKKRERRMTDERGADFFLKLPLRREWIEAIPSSAPV